MKTKGYYFFLSCFLLVFSATAWTQPSGKFKTKLKKHHIAFHMPPEFVNVPVIQHANLPSEYAIAKEGVDFEIRYQIHPLQRELKSYKKNLKNPTLKLAHPNYAWKRGLQNRVQNLASKDDSSTQVREFSDEAFTSDFIGDGGGISFFPIDVSVTLGYKYAIAMVIHRNFEADIYITFLGNERDSLEMNALLAFQAIRFVK